MGGGGNGREKGEAHSLGVFICSLVIAIPYLRL